MGNLEVVTGRTARFAKVVEEAGKPEPYTLWQDPDHDRDFQKAQREERISSTKSDAALVGYLKHSHALYLVFPKSLKKFRNRRIIGLKYDLLTQPKPKGERIKTAQRKWPIFRPPPRPTTTSQPAEPVVSRPPQAPPQPKAVPRFHLRARIVHTVEKSIDVEARNQREARQAALNRLESEPTDFSAGTTQLKIIKVSKSRELDSS
jgi:hypothetical protein